MVWNSVIYPVGTDDIKLDHVCNLNSFVDNHHLWSVNSAVCRISQGHHVELLPQDSHWSLSVSYSWRVWQSMDTDDMYVDWQVRVIRITMTCMVFSHVFLFILFNWYSRRLHSCQLMSCWNLTNPRGHFSSGKYLNF